MRMKTVSTAVLLLVLMGLAGCSYDPARISAEPLIVVDDHRDRDYHRDDDRHDRDWDRDRHRHDDHDHDHDRYYDDHDRRGDFCPPGQAKKGRC
ncbi:hypothetical protein KUW00_14585 [Halomonas sp. DP5N14-9]|nr:hypothetical protein [Halomonas sp. DP5N14-9]